MLMSTLLCDAENRFINGGWGGGLGVSSLADHGCFFKRQVSLNETREQTRRERPG